MSRAIITIDGHTRMDETLDINAWNKRPPELLADMIKPGARPEPYLQAVAIFLAHYAALNQGIRIDVRTHLDGCQIEVQHGP